MPSRSTRSDNYSEFELEGLSSTIEASIKNIVGAMNTVTVRTVPVALVDAEPRQRLKAAPTNGDGGEESIPPDAVGDHNEQRVAGNAEASRSKVPPRYTVPKLLKDLDLDSGPRPFKEFAQEIDPQTDNHRYLVIAAWLKEFRNIDLIDINHIFTCNQKMGWKTQKDVGQPFRQLKRKSYFDNPSKGQWEITHIGRDHVRAGD